MPRIDHEKSGDPEWIGKQEDDFFLRQTSVCRCGNFLSSISSYKCLYCKEWFCTECAEEHFGVTVEEWNRTHPKK